MSSSDLTFSLKQSSIWSLDICSAGKSVSKVSDLKNVPSSYRNGDPVLIISNSSFYQWIRESSESSGNGNWGLLPTGKEKFYFFSLINNDQNPEEIQKSEIQKSEIQKSEIQKSEKFEVYQIDPCRPAKRFIGDRGLSKGDLLIISCENSCDLYSYENGWKLKCSLSDQN